MTTCDRWRLWLVSCLQLAVYRKSDAGFCWHVCVLRMICKPKYFYLHNTEKFVLQPQSWSQNRFVMSNFSYWIAEFSDNWRMITVIIVDPSHNRQRVQVKVWISSNYCRAMTYKNFSKLHANEFSNVQQTKDLLRLRAQAKSRFFCSTDRKFSQSNTRKAFDYIFINEQQQLINKCETVCKQQRSLRNFCIASCVVESEKIQIHKNRWNSKLKVSSKNELFEAFAYFLLAYALLSYIKIIFS